MIYGIGIDIVQINRIKRLIDIYHNRFIQRILSKAEIEQLHDLNQHIYISGRFAAKEAIIKAMGERHDIRYSEIEILNDHKGKPYINNTSIIMEKLSIHIDAGQPIVNISISHERDYAIALVIIEIP
ncbi:MAG: holo-ACP synthase [Spirochaetota bacterium]|nr:holo-ACP synthase [Spirochaetota bacterium]